MTIKFDTVKSVTTPKIGDILVSSWGYDQTNIDYYQVVGVTKASVKIRKIGHTTVANNVTTIDVVPVKNAFTSDKTLTKRVKDTWNGVGYSVSIESYANAYLWDGTPQHETAGGYGH